MFSPRFFPRLLSYSQHLRQAAPLMTFPRFRQVDTSSGLERIGWLTDPHFESARKIKDMGFHSYDVDALLITGDIGNTPKHTRPSLEYLSQVWKKPIIYTLGNHDYRVSRNIETQRKGHGDFSDRISHLHWLQRSGPITISEETVLIGCDAWPDGGDIQLCQQRRDSKALENVYPFAIDDARKIHAQLNEIKKSKAIKTIMIAMHVPPFPEVSYNKKRPSNSHELLAFCSVSMGKVLKSFALSNPDISLEVYCGHTHTAVDKKILPNLHVSVGQAMKKTNQLAGIIQLDSEEKQLTYRRA